MPDMAFVPSGHASTARLMGHKKPARCRHWSNSNTCTEENHPNVLGATESSKDLQEGMHQDWSPRRQSHEGRKSEECRDGQSNCNGRTPPCKGLHSQDASKNLQHQSCTGTGQTLPENIIAKGLACIVQHRHMAETTCSNVSRTRTLGSTVRANYS